jgi:phytol kinase
MDYLGDLIGIVGTFIFVFLIIGIGTVLGRRPNLSSDFTRKVIHIGVGNWIFLWPFTFTHWYAAAFPPAVFIILNYASYRKEVFKAMERKEKAGGLGTVYYALSLTILAAVFFYVGKPWIGAVGMMLMAWADGFADVLGRRFGTHKYRVMGTVKSIEGSLGFFVVGILASFVTISFFQAFAGVVITQPVLFISIGIAAVATLIEALSPKGSDNLTVPIISSLLLYLLV